MVLCKFFLQGSCRFGSKCANEHLDIKLMIKTDVEAAINGKQWPLSTYGPFRDKPSIPNFIEDQSFEEVRMLCYEAKQKNFFDQFHQQFNKEALEANSKMKALLQMTPDIVDVLISVYDVPSDTSSNGVTVGKTPNNVSNPFGLANSVASSAGSIFAKSPNQSTFPASNQETSGIYKTPYGLTTGLFSQQNQFLKQPLQNANIFRQAVQASQPQQGLFAQALQTVQQQHNQPHQGVFAQAAQQTAATQGLFPHSTQNIFMQAPQQQQQTNQNTQNIFQQSLTNTGSQQQQANTNIFQQNQSIATQQQQIQNQQPPSGLFQQAALQMQNSVGQTNQLSQVNSSLYSRLEDLTAEEIDAFKADYFLPGKIPFNPPPRELIN